MRLICFSANPVPVETTDPGRIDREGQHATYALQASGLETLHDGRGAALVDAGVAVVGGCCGVGPAHIAAVARRQRRVDDGAVLAALGEAPQLVGLARAIKRELRTKVVITTVGPYQLYGSELVGACAAAGLRLNRFYTAHFNCSPTRASRSVTRKRCWWASRRSRPSRAPCRV